MGKIKFSPIYRYFETKQGPKILPSIQSYFDNLDYNLISDIILCYPAHIFKNDSIYNNKDYLKSLVKSDKINIWFLNNEMTDYCKYVEGLYVKNLPGYYYPTHSERRQKIDEIILDPLVKIIDSKKGDKDILVIVLSTLFYKNKNKDYGIFSYFYYFLYVLYGDRNFWYSYNYKKKVFSCNQSFFKKITFKNHSRKDNQVYWFNQIEEEKGYDDINNGYSGYTQEDLDQMYRDAYDNDPSNQWNTD
ncbi:MAG: hypothetical protein R6V72_12455 [Cyclobacterium sp.]|uniref:hypothetical protein n=1 Tax=Cyclobacterium sp. TaxID=1966343 RepID=UPI0039707686